MSGLDTYKKELQKESIANTLAGSYESYHTAAYDSKAVLEWAKATAATNTLVDLEQSYPALQQVDTNQFLLSSTPQSAMVRGAYYKGRLATLKAAIQAIVDRDKLLKIEEAYVQKAVKADTSGAYTGSRVTAYARIKSYQTASNQWSLAANTAHAIVALAANFPSLPIDTGMVKAVTRASLYSQRAQQSANAALALQQGGPGPVLSTPTFPGLDPSNPLDPTGTTTPGEESPGAMAGKGIAYVLGFAALVGIGYKVLVK